MKRSRLSKQAGIEKGIRLIRVTDMYAKMNPLYTRESVEDVVAKLVGKGQRLDAITVDYHLRPKQYGGLGMGKLRGG